MAVPEDRILGHPPETAVGRLGLGSRPGGFLGLLTLSLVRESAGIHPGAGIGAQLLDALLGEADRRRVPVVLLEVRADNELAQGLYRRRGFAEVGRRRGYYQPSGADAVVMKRELLHRAH